MLFDYLNIYESNRPSMVDLHAFLLKKKLENKSKYGVPKGSKLFL